jgi:two-component system response regulator YesN
MRIMLVDDEPIFLVHLKEVVQACCEQLECTVNFVSECYSAEKAIALIPETLPDLIFTDIRMKAMDGLELAQRIHEEWPLIKVIIVSGYPSFDYARSAMRARVVDYLVKPIEPQAVLEVLTQTLDHMNSNQYQRKRALLQMVMENGELDPSYSGKDSSDSDLIACDRYGIIAVNSSEFQFNPLLYDSHMSMQSEYAESIRPMLEPGEEVWIFPNANKRGLLFVIALRHYDELKLKRLGNSLLERYSTAQSFAIAAISPLVSEASELRESVRKLTRSMDMHHVIGTNVMLHPDNLERGMSRDYTWITQAQEKTFNYLGNKHDWSGIRESIMQLFEIWRIESCPSLFMEINLRTVMDAIGILSSYQDPLSRKELEQAIQDLLFASSSFTEAGDAFVDWLQSIAKPSDPYSENKGEALFHRIQQFITANVGEPLNLLTLTEEFSISSTYLCNLFRIYSESTFVEYFTELRINKAKELLIDHPEIPIKDISEIVGYTDRHYFSKVFKSLAEMTPSEFRNQ